jgi:hypothetical protein
MQHDHARRPLRLRRLVGFLLLGVSVLFIADNARADDDAQDRVTRAPAPPSTSAVSADFLLGAPRAWLSFRGTQLFPRAGGDLFAFVSDQLTIDRGQLKARGFATDLGITLGSRLDLVGGFDIARHTTPSEYRHFVGSNAQPITQRTNLQQDALSVGMRYSPLGRGRNISRFAFIPRRVAPYVGGGFTAAYYDFSQQGQFVDAKDLSIFTDRFASNGWSFGPYVNGGADVQVWKRLYVSFDGRYSWLHSGLDSDFSGFDGIDLAGFRASSGISVVF